MQMTPSTQATLNHTCDVTPYLGNFETEEEPVLDLKVKLRHYQWS